MSLVHRFLCIASLTGKSVIDFVGKQTLEETAAGEAFFDNDADVEEAVEAIVEGARVDFEGLERSFRRSRGLPAAGSPLAPG